MALGSKRSGGDPSARRLSSEKNDADRGNVFGIDLAKPVSGYMISMLRTGRRLSQISAGVAPVIRSLFLHALARAKDELDFLLRMRLAESIS